MTLHTNKQFDSELELIRTQLLQMGGLVESMISDAVAALVTGDMDLVARVKDREKQVNKLEVEIDERITTILVRHQPAAIDLRTLMSVTKMLTDMERSGDEAEKIANVARRIHAEDSRFVPEIELRHMSDAVATMLS